MIGLGRPGGRETTTVSAASEVKTPWSIFLMSCVVDGILATVATLALFVVIGTGAAVVNRGDGYWRALLAGLRTAADVLKWLLSVPLLAWFWRIWHHGRLLVHQRWEPEQHDPYAHQPYVARPTETRGRTWWDDYYDQEEEPETPPPEPSQIPPINLMDPAGVWHNEGIPPLPAVNGDWKLITFLRAHVGRVRPFSRRGAVVRNGYTRREWETLEAWCIKHKFHSKGSRILTPLGKRWAVGTIGRMVNGDHPPTDPPAGHEAKSARKPTHPSPTEGVGE